MSWRPCSIVILHAQRSAGLPLRAVKPLGGVLAPNQLYEAIPAPLKPRSFGQMQNYDVARSPGLFVTAEKCENPMQQGLVIGTGLMLQ